MRAVLRRHAAVTLAVILAAGVAVPVDTPLLVLALVPLYGVARHGTPRAAALGGAAYLLAAGAHGVLWGLQGGVAESRPTRRSWSRPCWPGGCSPSGQRLGSASASCSPSSAAAEERLRIARELHDAVGHDVSLMIVQAQALGATSGDDAVREATDAIADLGRRTMGEMHRTLRALRAEEAERSPRQGLAALDDVLDGARKAGVSVTVAVEGPPRELAPALDASAFRIVQEAVTNVVRHAGGAPAAVVVRYGDAALELVVADEGPGESTTRGNGHGLVGMRERAALFGGTLTAAARRRPRLRGPRHPPLRSAVIRVVIADDQPLMRAGFRAVLEATGSIEIVAEAGDGDEAVRVAEALRPDVVLMDIRMPGTTASRRPRRLPRQRVLVLTTFGLDEYIVEALRAGASGFLTKDAPAQDLVAAVRAVAAGDAVLSPRSRDGCSTASRRACRRPWPPVAARSRSSPSASARCCSCWRPGSPTRRSPPRSSSPSRPPRRTSPTAREARAARPRAGGDLRLRARARGTAPIAR